MERRVLNEILISSLEIVILNYDIFFLVEIANFMQDFLTFTGYLQRITTYWFNASFSKD